MKTLYEKLNELENISSNIDKEEHLKDILNTYKNAEAFFRLTFNDTVYGVQEKTFYAAFQDMLNPEDEWEHVSNFLATLEEPPEPSDMVIPDLIKMAQELQALSGNDQIMYIRGQFENLPAIKRKWFSRAILHDLRAGVQVKTINNVFKSLGLSIIPKFALQLAKKLDLHDDNDVRKRIQFPAEMEIKYDGIRVQATIVDGKCTLMSRRGKDRTESWPQIVSDLEALFPEETVILDGEVIARSFQSLTRKDDISERYYVIFDLLVDENLQYRYRWDNLYSLLVNKGCTANPYELINNIKVNQNNTVILLPEHYTAHNVGEAREFYREANRRGEEGIMIKPTDKTYKRGSRLNMFKCKKVFTADLLIIGYKYGEGKRAGKVATLCLEDASGTIKVDVGSGIDDYWCDELTKQLRAKPINTEHPVVKTYDVPLFMYKICEIKYNEITETGSIRFPRFITIRDDKDEPDDLSTEKVRQA
jgi:ATP-dependent DNA ligase